MKTSRRIYVMMGVAGSGKTVVGARIAHSLGVEFVDGDDYHSADNVARMAAGIPLTDDDRAEWLRTIAGRLRESKSGGEGLVMACSALKRAYRDTLRQADPDLQLVYLRAPRSVIAS